MTELSPLSYTNKDFNSIYTELLEYAKRLSCKWDPTISGESDPGVILLKLAAIVGDKDNYNIDKNVLELMPSTVTQMPAARQLFNQCGYTMRHYLSATGIVNFTITKLDIEGVDNTKTVMLEDFIKICDAESKIVYSTIPDVASKAVKYKTMSSLKVIEGVATQYTINNEPLITLENLDSNNRLYFPTTLIPENGIFITNQFEDNVTTNYDEWMLKDNLEIVPPRTRCYRFGLSYDGTSSYIEFPSDIAYLMDNGIKITYVITSGKQGNISSNRLTKFYVDPKCTLDSDEITLSAENVIIQNPLPITNGQDPETIDEAYKSYQRVKDTFKTLVSLKDYRDYLLSSNVASNVIVCDRTNDIQSTYQIVTNAEYQGSDSLHIIEKTSKGSSVDELQPFDLRVYAFNYVPNVYDKQTYDQTFTAFSIPDASNYAELDNVKSLQHEFKDFKSNDVIFIKNKYELTINIIPKYRLSTNEQYDVRSNIEKAMWSAVNSQNLTFGEEISYDVIYQAVSNADHRIKAVSVSYPTYTTYVVYTSTSGDCILENSIEDVPTDIKKRIFVKNVLAGVTPLLKTENDFTISANHKFVSTIHETTPTEGAYDTIQGTTQLYWSKVGDNSQLPTLLENESLLLTSDSYIEDTPYSSYVKFVYDLPSKQASGITSGNLYELAGDDFIIFFWKAAESDNYYTYCKYTADSAARFFKFSSNDNLSQYDDGPNNINQTVSAESVFSDDDKKLLRELFEGKGNLSANAYNNLNKSIRNVTGDKFVLSGTNTIKTFRQNSLIVNHENGANTNLAYWILNNTDNKILFDDNNKYVLKSGEFFFYTNLDKTFMSVNGEGTEISVESSEGSYEISSPLSYEELITTEIHNIPWVDIGFENQLTLTEKERILLGPGATLSASGSIENSVTFEGSGSIRNEMSYTTSSDSSSVHVPTVPSGWKIESRFDIVSDAGHSQKLVRDDKRTQLITINSYDSKNKLSTLNFLLPMMWKFKNEISLPDELDDDSITYKVEFKCGDRAFNNITIIKTTSDDLHDVISVKFDEDEVYSSSSGWSESLNNPVIIETTQGQNLTKEFITWLRVNANAVNAVKDYIFFQSNIPLNIKNSLVTNIEDYRQANGLSSNLSLYTYTLSDDTDSTDTEDVVLKYHGIIDGKEIHTTESSKEFTLSEGTYILTVLSEDIDLINYSENKKDDGTIEVTGGLKVTPKVGKAYYASCLLAKNFNFYRLDVESTNSYTLSIELKNTTNSLFVIKPFLKYDDFNDFITQLVKDALSDDDFKDSQKVKTKKYEILSSLFTGYTPEKFDLIAAQRSATIIDPFDSQSFFNPDHVYNKFTICEWITPDSKDNQKIRILNTIG